MGKRITKDLSKTGAVGKLDFAKDGHYIVRDKTIPSLGIRVSLQTKSWTWWRGKKGNPVKVGLWGQDGLTYEQARDKVQEWQKEDKSGYGPLTLEGGIDRTIATLRGKRRPKTLLHYESLKKYIKPWADKPIEAITKELVVTMHAEIGKKGLVQADNMMRLLSAVMNTCEIEPNPVRVLKNRKLWNNAKNRDEQGRKRERDIAPDKLPALYKGLLAIPPSDLGLGRDMLLVCLYAGLRSVEARSLTWERVNFKAKTLTIPGEIAKNGSTLVLPLTRQLEAILATRQKLNAAEYEKGDPRLAYVFPNGRRDGKKPYMDNAAFHYKQVVTAVRKETKDKTFKFTTHALRHNFVTAAVNARIPFEQTKYLVNHRPANITSHYTHLKVDDVRDDAQKVADHIDTACNVSKEAFRGLFAA